MCGVYLHRARLILLILFVPAYFLLSNCSSILVAIGQDKQVADYAHAYVIAYLPGFFFEGLFDAQRKFLNSIGRSSVFLIVLAIGTFVHIIACFVFVNVYQF